MAAVGDILHLNSYRTVINVILDNIRNTGCDLLLETDNTAGRLPVIVWSSLTESNLTVIGTILYAAGSIDGTDNTGDTAYLQMRRSHVCGIGTASHRRTGIESSDNTGNHYIIA